MLAPWKESYDQSRQHILPRKSHGRRSLVGCSPWGREELDMTERPHFHFTLSCIGEGNGNPLQCSCLENPRDGGVWWVAVYGVAQGRTWLKRLSSSSSRQHIKKQSITLSTNGPSSQGYDFSSSLYGFEGWTIKKAECWRIVPFELWCWRVLSRVPWTARRYNQSILKEISPGCSLEVLILKLKLQYFGHLMQRTDSLKNTLMLGKIEGRWRMSGRGQDGWMA